MSEKRFKSTLDEETMSIMPFLVSDNEEEAFYNLQGCVDLLNEQQEQLDLYKEAILTMLGILSDKGIIFSGVKDE